VESGDEQGKLLAERTSTQSKKNNQSLTSCTGMQKGYLTREKNCSIFFICCIQETHLQDDKSFKIRGYQVFRSDRKERKKGGVMTLVRNNINARETKQYMEEAEYLEVKVTIREALYTMSTTTVLMIRCSH
jgi:exonuclease III